MLAACRAAPDLDAPLVRALLAAKDPVTGRGLTDEEIRDELIVFIAAGHDTTATTLTYALWQLGRNPQIQEAVRAEVAELGDRELTCADIARPRLHRAGAAGGVAAVPARARCGPGGGA